MAKSITEFWRRWHISLSTWFRDYVYIPLGGNRVSKGKHVRNIMVVWMLTGLWHGAAWKFVFWGAMHGAGLAVHKACRPWLDRLPDRYWIKALAWTLTMIYVSLLWVFFRADSWTDSWLIIQNIFTNFSLDYIVPFIKARYVWLVMMTFIIAVHAIPQRWHDRMLDLFVKAPWPVKLFGFIVVVQLVIEFMSENVAPFIYFQF